MTALTSLLLPVLLAGLAISITSGIIGSYVVVKRIVFISGSISHSVLGGMGAFLWLRRTYDLPWLSPLYGALIAALLSAFLIGWIHLHYREREDTAIAALWSLGMAAGVTFISFTPGYNVELTHFLFGNILWVTRSDLFLLLFLDLFVILITALFHRRFLSICFDEKQALLQNAPVSSLYFLLLSLIALSVVLLIQVVGAVLVIAMLAIPAAIAGTFTHRLSVMIFLAIALSALFTTAGTLLSFSLNWPPGATIALAASSCYLLNFFRQKLLFSS
jgi:zinc transport system permease protein